jgi:predicted transcriptional regulator
MKRINPYKLFVGCFLPNWLVCRTEISEGAKICYARLAQYAGNQGYCFPFQETLAKEMGVSERQIRRRLHELTENNLIELEQRGLSQSNTYYFLWHPWMELESEHVDLERPDIDDRSRPDVRFRSDRTRGSGQDRTFAPGPIKVEENQLRESSELKKEENFLLAQLGKKAKDKNPDFCHESHCPQLIGALSNNYCDQHAIKFAENIREQGEDHPEYVRACEVLRQAGQNGAHT